MEKRSIKTGYEKRDIYQEITNQVISEMEKGNIIWKQGWNIYGRPKNIIAENKYRGWNSLYLNFITSHKGFTAPYFLTYKQAHEKGGSIKKGAKGFPVVYWLQYQKQKNQGIESQAAEQDTSGGRVYRVPKYYTVFNIDQTEGLDITVPALTPLLKESSRIEMCENVVRNIPSCPEIEHKGNMAYYMPQLDTVVMPPFGLFHTETAYYATLFHELAHSTGHVSRLNRPELMSGSTFGKEDYSKEELVAEFTASFVCGSCGITQELENSAAYLKGWLSRLRDDKTLLFRAASQAQVAADYILGVHENAQTNECSLAAA